MRIKQIILNLSLLIAIFSSTKLFSQDFIENFIWPQEFDMEQLTPELRDMHIVILADKRHIELSYTDASEQYLKEKVLTHRRIWVNSDESVSTYNKVYIPLSSGNELLRAGARVITTGGKVIDLDASSIRSSENLEDAGSYKFFALDGVEKGSVVEYFYVINQGPQLNGAYNRYQTDELKLNNSFTFSSPANLIFAFKSYNGFPEVVQDTTATSTINLYKAFADTIQPLFPEDFAVYHPHKQMVIHKLDANTSSHRSKLISYTDIGKGIYNAVCPEWNSKVVKSVTKFVDKEVKIDRKASEEEQIRALENFVKANFLFQEGASNDPMQTISSKTSNEVGYLAFYAALFKELDIPFELVATVDRNELKFDKDFDSYLFINDFLLYLPNLDMYLSPSDQSSRLGLVPPQLSHVDALFVKPLSVAGINSAISEIGFIKALPASRSMSEIFIEATIKPDENVVEYDVTRSFGGYAGSTLQAYWSIMETENRDELEKDFLLLPGPGGDIKSSEIENASGEFIGNKPLIFKGKVAHGKILDKAGDNLLLNVGMLIGQQSEMYQEKERNLEVENQFNRAYKRILTINIPAGYEIANPDDLKISEGDGSTMVFTSDYEMNAAGQLIITVDEFYDQISYPVAEFEGYKKVINAAADFNKVVLVLKKV